MSRLGLGLQLCWLWALCLWPLQAGAEPLTQKLTQAAFASVDTATPPPPADSRWHPVELPHVWSQAEQRGRGGWYRLRFTHDAAGEPLALYLPQAHVNGALWLNGSRLGDGGRLDDPMSFHWNHPFFFNLPEPLLKAGENELLVRLRGAGGFGLLSAIEVGPEQALRERYERRQFWQADVHGVLLLLLLSIAALGLGIWSQRRHDTQYLWLSVSCLAWSAFALFLYGRDFWIDPLLMQWLAQCGAVWWVTGLALYVHRQTDGPRPRVEWLLVGLSLLANGGAWLLDPLSRVHVYSAGHVFALATTGYLIGHSFRHGRRSGQAASFGLAAVCALVLLVGVHDVVLTMPVAWSSMEFVRALQDWRFYLTPFGAPLASVLLAAHLARRFVATLGQFEQLNADLERRVAQAQALLAQHFEARRVQERAQAATDERERIVREMHDGIGGQLMTALRGVERGVFSNERITEVLQDSLDDLRLLIDASSQQSQLQPALAGWRHRWGPRLDALSLPLQWHVDDGLDALVLAPDVILQLMRILQEAVTNAVKHAQASELRVGVCLQDGVLHLRVADNGIGLPAPQPDTPTRGHGTRSMRTRAQALGATLVVSATVPQGTTVDLRWVLPAAI